MPVLIDPPVDADADLTDFSFMPLEIGRLKRSKSWLLAKKKPELGFYMINLWTAAWHNIPAGSLEDDDQVLCDLALCSPRRWPAVRADVLRGWVKATDGRLYHEFLGDKCREALTRKTNQRARTELARKAKSDKKSVKSKPPASVTKSVTESVTTPVTDSVTGLSLDPRDRDRDRDRESFPLPPSKPPSPVVPPRGEILDRYCRLARIDMSKLQRLPAFVALPALMHEWIVVRGCDAERDVWPTIEGMLAKSGKAPGSPNYFTAAVLRARDERMKTEPTDEERWTYRTASFFKSGHWSERWGPKPDEAGCLAPTHLCKLNAA